MTIKEFLYLIFQLLLICIILIWIATYNVFIAIIFLLIILIALFK